MFFIVREILVLYDKLTFINRCPFLKTYYLFKLTYNIYFYEQKIALKTLQPKILTKYKKEVSHLYLYNGSFIFKISFYKINLDLIFRTRIDRINVFLVIGCILQIKIKNIWILKNNTKS